MRGIRTTLLIAFATVVFTTVITVSLFFRLRAEAEIDEFDERTDEIQLVRMEHWLLGYHSSAGDWYDLQAFIEEMGVLYGQQILVEDAEGQLVGNSQPLLEEQTGLTDWTTVPLFSRLNDERIGTLYVSSAPGLRTTLRRSLRESLTDIAIGGAILAAAIAIPLSILFGRPIIRSVSNLAAAAEQFGSGNLGIRTSQPATRELRTLAESFNRMAHRIEHAQALRRSLVADTAHEIRTPLSNIRGFIEAQTDGLVSETEALSAIDEESTMLASLVDDLQLLAAADARELTLRVEPCTAGELLRRPVERARALAAEEGTEVVLDLSDDDETRTLHVDRLRMTQVLTNLLNNAVQYCPPSSRIVVLAGSRTAPTDGPTGGATGDGGFEIVVEDTGPGIPEDQHEHIFDRFYRLEHSRSRKTGGSGLGLTIARKIVELHGGSISAENGDGGGARFRMWLPGSASIVPPSVT
ncbi:MAG: sensor histidine kinase [Spirochaetaceae bacterium]|nr:MAG: sensor histidine kinase [Spirochaetaceae bacterium]